MQGDIEAYAKTSDREAVLSLLATVARSSEPGVLAWRARFFSVATPPFLRLAETAACWSADAVSA
ncbi:hypothetical protein [Massilia rubra]|uniref:Uncharacterized protein n=1 Tax=Massilia rubra TaxID=2607910 RepID=A0ABX0LU18_9BURK|nr:hypothetical protein [Massilia rubra]NHZ37977.1 hypothetical protein [Massilia rubra]